VQARHISFADVYYTPLLMHNLILGVTRNFNQRWGSNSRVLGVWGKAEYSSVIDQRAVHQVW